jgi:hypothetical protein
VKLCPLTLKEGHRLTAFENRVLRIFGPKSEEAAGGWRRLHNERLHYLSASPNIIRVIKSRRMKWAGHVACMGLKWIQILVEKSEGKRPLRKHRRRWEDNIRMDLREILWKGVDWIHLSQERDQWWNFMYMVMNLRVPRRLRKQSFLLWQNVVVMVMNGVNIFGTL